MEFALYLAMTPGEMAARPLPEHPAWMACHFENGKPGITDLPIEPLPGGLLILNDEIPMDGQEPEVILGQLRGILINHHFVGLLLDFQRPAAPNTLALAETLRNGLLCPVIAPPAWSPDGQPVFLPPVPPDISLAAYLVPWQGRDIWLEIGTGGTRISLTADGAKTLPAVPAEAEAAAMHDQKLHCHYRLETSGNCATFHLWRSRADLPELLAEAKELGVQGAVGLLQELG